MGVVEGVEGADVTPVSAVAVRGPGHLVVLEVVDERLTAVDEGRDDVAAHVVVGVGVVGVGLDRPHQRVGREDVVAHRGERRVRIVRGAGRIGGLLEELGDLAAVVGIDTAERHGLRTRNPDARHRALGTRSDVGLDHLLGIHPVDVVGAEHDDVLGLLVVDQVQRLEDRIGATGVPAGSEPLLRRDRRDVFAVEPRWPPGLRDVAVERVRLVLREHAQPRIPGVDEVAEDEVDEPVSATERHGGLGAVHRQRKESFPLAAGEDDPEDVAL